MRRGRSFLGWIPVVLGTAVFVALASCTDRLFVPPATAVPAVRALALAPSAAMTGADAAACARADGARVRLVHDGAVVLDTTVAVSDACDRGVALQVRLGSDRGLLELSLALLSGGKPLFQGSAGVELQPGRRTDVPVTMAPVPAGLAVPASLRTFTKLGDSVALGGAVVFATGDTVAGLLPSWTDDGKGIVAAVNGFAYARAEGSAVLTAWYGGLSQTSAAAVNAVVASVAVNGVADTANMLVGGTRSFSAVARDSNRNALRRTIGWWSSDAAVAAVDADGLVRAGSAPGSALIVASAGAKADSFRLSVGRSPVAMVSVTPSDVLVDAGKTAQLIATVYDAAGRVLAGRDVAWSSSAPDVASVSATGLVTGVDVGQARIAAVSEGVPGYSMVRVNALPVLQVTPDSVYVDIYWWQTYGPTPITATLQVTNAGAGTLEGLSVALGGTPEGGAIDSMRLSSTTAPATVTIFFPDSAQIHVYTGAVIVSSTTEGVVPVVVPVVYDVRAGG